MLHQIFDGSSSYLISFSLTILDKTFAVNHRNNTLWYHGRLYHMNIQRQNTWLQNECRQTMNWSFLKGNMVLWIPLSFLKNVSPSHGAHVYISYHNAQLVYIHWLCHMVCQKLSQSPQISFRFLLFLLV